MKSGIKGVKIKELKVHHDERGCLWEILRNDDPQYLGFGQAYVSVTHPGVVKGFHEHRTQTDNVTCVKGKLKLVLMKYLDHQTPYDDPHGIEEYILVPGGLMVTIPPKVMHGWKNIGMEDAMVVNIPNFAYNRADPDEERYPPHEWYNWGTEDR